MTPKPKGPLVFLDYDKEELDDSYTQELWAPNQAELDKRNAQKSAQAIARLGPPRRLAYGPAEGMIEKARQGHWPTVAPMLLPTRVQMSERMMIKR